MVYLKNVLFFFVGSCTRKIVMHIYIIAILLKHSEGSTIGVKVVMTLITVQRETDIRKIHLSKTLLHLVKKLTAVMRMVNNWVQEHLKVNIAMKFLFRNLNAHKMLSFSSSHQVKVKVLLLHAKGKGGADGHQKAATLIHPHRFLLFFLLMCPHRGTKECRLSIKDKDPLLL